MFTLTCSSTQHTNQCPFSHYHRLHRADVGGSTTLDVALWHSSWHCASWVLEHIYCNITGVF